MFGYCIYRFCLDIVSIVSAWIIFIIKEVADSIYIYSFVNFRIVSLEFGRKMAVCKTFYDSCLVSRDVLEA